MFSAKFSAKSITIMGMMLALRVILGFVTIQPLPEFRLFSVTFIPMAVVAFLFGPLSAIIFGIVGDTLGFLANPALGIYFPGFAISEAVTCLIYALFTHKRKTDNVWWLTFRVTLARIAIALVVTFGLNFVWFRFFGHMFGVPEHVRNAGSFFVASGRLINNLVQLPFFVAFSVIFIRLADRLQQHSGVGKQLLE